MVWNELVWIVLVENLILLIGLGSFLILSKLFALEWNFAAVKSRSRAHSHAVNADLSRGQILRAYGTRNLITR